MTLGTIMYVVTLLISAAIFLIDLSYGTVAIMGTLLVLPIVMLIFLIILRVNTKVTVECKNPLAEKNTMDEHAKVTIIMNVENRCKFLPIQKGIASVSYFNKFTGEKGKLKVRFSVDAGKTRSRRIVIDALHCGTVAVSVDRVKIYDYFSIFAMTVGKKFEKQYVLVMPPVKDMYIDKDKWYQRNNLESDRFSLYKKGDDPSEIFNVRDFEDGDSFHRIHWKLSSKVGHYMVKEGSLPLSKLVTIFIDLCVKNEQESDLLVQGLYSIAMRFLENAVPIEFIWYDYEIDIIKEFKIESEEELFWTFEELFKSLVSEDPEELSSALADWDNGRAKDTAMYVTVVDHDEHELDHLTLGEIEVIDMREEH
ncbi:DUF58 domain-containing protein [Eubacterium xylanophilum]|uniref:DUF58 domain-containing protein n=1 Tax=Eubacterium xylanophilum TaxID=39497 RepID=UPI00047E2868|nr:DUF58 domain-containing protein [Eubacterium xylanophilum]